MQQQIRNSGTVPVMANCLREADINVDANSISTEFVSVPFFRAHIPCGPPTEIGYVEDGEYIHLPKSLVADASCTICVLAKGDSMKDAGITDGDILTVHMTKDVHDGDAVVVSLDGEVTCKALYRPEEGCTVLLPRNEAYEPIVLEDGKYSRVDILGVVTNIKKHPTPYTPIRICSTLFDKFKKFKRKKLSAVPSDVKVESALRRIRPHLKYKRQWFPVMRILMDCGYYKFADFRGFVDDLQSCLGTDFDTLPDAHDLGKLYDKSFRQPFEQWDREDAPVSGKWFDDYSDIARKYKAMIA